MYIIRGIYPRHEGHSSEHHMDNMLCSLLKAYLPLFKIEIYVFIACDYSTKLLHD